MTKEELQKLEDEGWEKFQKDYPVITNDSFIGRLRLAFFGKGVIRLVWENAWLRGMNRGIDLVMEINATTPPPESAPPEPKSGQPESPGSHSS